MPKTEKAKTSKPKGRYSCVFEVSLTKFESEGHNLAEAFASLAPSVTVKGKSVLTVKDGNKTYSKIMPPILVRRFIQNKVYRLILAKQFEINLK